MKTNLFSLLGRYSMMAPLLLCLITSHGFAGTASKVARLCPVPKCDTGAELGVLVIHGIGSQDDCFAQPMIDDLKKKLSKSDCAKICWKPVWWAHILDRKEDILLRELLPEVESHGFFNVSKRMRTFVLKYIGDLTAYRYLPNISERQKSRNEIYEGIHGIVYDSIVELKNELRGKEKPVIVMAHSLGSVIMFDYIRDRQNHLDEGIYGHTPLERMETLAGFITFGSPYALFTLADDPILSINFSPGKKAKWLNFYDDNDVLGWPLKKLAVCGACTIEDQPITIGWTLGCHNEYWTNDNFTKPVAQYISDILKLYP